jgi:hypothetical protein
MKRMARFPAWSPTIVLLSVALAGAAFVAPSSSVAQETGAGGLDAAETAADRGDVKAAREALAAYLAGAASGIDPGSRTRLDYLVGRLSADPDSAEVAYLRAAIDGAGPYASRARLRLAQLRLARGDHARAADHLARLRADDPGGDLVPVSWVWTARAAEQAGDATAACGAWTAALTALGPTHPVHDEARQGGSRCEERAREPGEVDTFTVQLGAFGTEEAAMRLRDGAAGIGVAVRVDSPSGGVHVYRVRAGRFGSREDAERLAERFRAHGFEAIAVPEEP